MPQPGDALATMGDNKGATKEFQEVIHIKPEYAGAHYGLGVALWLIGDHENAVKEFREAIRMNPEFAEAHCNVACAYSLKHAATGDERDPAVVSSCGTTNRRRRHLTRPVQRS